MPISVVFDPPLPSDSPSTFNTKAFTLLGDLNDWSTEANALPGEVATNLSALLAAPPAIGSTTPAAGSFTGINASGANEAVTSYGVSPLYLSCTTAFGIDVGPSLGFYGKADGGAATQFGNISARKENATSGNTAGYLSFATRVHGSTPTEKMRISSTGAVTIPGTLTVSGNIVAASGVYAAGFASFLKTAYWGTMVTGATGSASDFVITVAGSATPVMYVPTGTNTARFAGNVECYGGTFGYGTGAGGTVTQATSKSTNVTLNKPSGQITMHNAALAAGASVGFILNNNTVAATSMLSVVGDLTGGPDPGNYRIEPIWVTSGSCAIRVTNVTAGSLSEALRINFQVNSGAIS